MICPICTDPDKITWSDLTTDKVELCKEHQPQPEGQLPLSGEFE